MDTIPTFYTPEEWRGRPTDKKQGSSEEKIIINGLKLESFHAYAIDLYKDLLDNGVAPEQARIVLPQSMYTEWYWTGSLAAFARVCKLRLSEDSQDETRQIAKQISELMRKHFPISWKYLVKEEETW